MANMVMGIAFGTAATIWTKNGDINSKGGFCYVEYEDLGEDKIPIEFPPRNERNSKAIQNPDCGWFYRASATDFKKIPGSPIAYWLSGKWLDCFSEKPMSDYVASEGAVKTGNNERFIRFLWEVSASRVGISNDWRKHPKGGEYRKWYGNLDSVVSWTTSSRKHYRNNHIARIPTEKIWNIKGITWTAVSSSSLSFRIEMKDEIANNAALFIYPKKAGYLNSILACLNSCQTMGFLNVISPTLNYLVGDVMAIPFPDASGNYKNADDLCLQLIHSAKADWDSYETSWDFTHLPLLYPDHYQPSLKTTYQSLRTHWQSMTGEIQQLEEENNRIFIKAYGLQDELTPEVPLKEITLTCNPYYRYGGNKTEEELEALLLADTMREFISYAVGCMFGRYSLDKEGLILANQGERLADYTDQIPDPSFMPDDDNVIPLINFDGEWFEDDLSERFKQFLKTTFGEEHFEENLRFIEEAIGKDIKKFFIRDFYTDHIKRYKKRPIYWLFSSPKGSFNALIYLHRYEPGTASIVLNDYLREFHTKLTARKDSLEQIGISATASQKEKAQALRRIEKINKVLDEINDYEHDILYPLATQQIDIDLDDGVKANYPKFGKALKKVAGLSTK